VRPPLKSQATDVVTSTYDALKPWLSGSINQVLRQRPCYAVSTVAYADEKAPPLGRDLNENLSSAVAVAATEEKHDQEDDDYPSPDRHRPFLLSFRFVA
jgi:hypothetical protein